MNFIIPKCRTQEKGGFPITPIIKGKFLYDNACDLPFSYVCSSIVQNNEWKYEIFTFN